jgi:transposase
MKAYAKDMREHVLRAVDQGYPRAEIVRMFGVSLASIKRYLKLRKETGDLSPKAIPGRPSKKYAALEAGLVAQLQAYPDIALEGHCQLWENTPSMWVDHPTRSRAMRRVGWTRKKKRWVPMSATRRSEPPGEEQSVHCQHSSESVWMSVAPLSRSRPSLHEHRKERAPQAGCR